MNDLLYYRWFITLVEEIFASNNINTAERKFLFEDMPSILEYINEGVCKDADSVSINKISSQLVVKSNSYERLYAQNGWIVHQKWYKNGNKHRDNDKPAIMIYGNGDVKHQSWYQNDKLYRTGGSADTTVR